MLSVPGMAVPEQKGGRMRSPRSLHSWARRLLPDQSSSSHAALVRILRALLVGFSTDRCQLARQLPGPTAAKGGRQFLSRWLARPHWETDRLYARLLSDLEPYVRGADPIPVLIDHTYLKRQWSVLQVSIPWQGRALPIYRLVCHHTAPELDLARQLQTMLTFLGTHLPGSRRRYVLVMDRGFPSNPWIRTLTEGGWRFVIRVSGKWRMTHPEYTGKLAEASLPEGEIGEARRFGGAILGDKKKGRARWSQADVVRYAGEGHQEVWYLLTTEEAPASVAIYRERMKIEGEFRDLKGPWGLDELANWHEVEEVSRFLALVAVYEWRLAYLWERHQLEHWRARLEVKGRLSWIRTTREWIRIQLIQRASRAAPACL